MNITKKLMAMLLLAVASLCGAPFTAAASQLPPDGTSADMPWFVPLSFGGFNFDIPAGSVVEKGENMLVKYPDGSFGLSLSKVASPGCEQHTSFLTARKLVDQLSLTDSHVSKETIAGVKCAKATGKIDNTSVTILIFPIDGQETTTIMMASPERSAWAEHFMKSLTR